MNASPETMLSVPRGTIDLRRLPEIHDPSLRAWDAADEYVLASLAEDGSNEDIGLRSAADDRGRWLIVDDLFGALSVALSHHRPQSWGDSLTSHEATAANLRRNALDPALVDLVPSTDTPTGPIDVAIIKIPRSLALLEDQLRRLRPLLHEGSVVLGAGMVKSIHRSTLDLFEQTIGPSPTSLAKKKARLIRPTIDLSLEVDSAPGPTSYELPSGRTVIEHANVFSRGKLDIGSRVLLDHLPSVEAGADVLDLGCGNGVLGLSLADRAKDTLNSLTFVDESYHAIASAAATEERWDTAVPCRFLTARTLRDVPDASIDVVLNNPPFHAHQSRGDAIAMAMFDDARRVLRPGGRLIVVGNRHLSYHRELRRRFRQVDVIGSTPKFVVLAAVA